MKNSFFLVLLFVSAGLFSQSYQPRIDSSGKYPYRYYEGDPLEFRIYMLKNGLTVMLSVNKAVPRIYTCIAVRAGSKNDPSDNTGLAHYLEHMLFKGTDQYGTEDYEKEKIYLDRIDALYERYNKIVDTQQRKKIYAQIDSVSKIASGIAIANEYDKMMQHIGAQGTNAYTSFEETVYINDIPSNHIGDWIQIEGERFRNPVLRLFHTELEAVYEEKNISLDSDGYKTFTALVASLFRNHTYGKQTTIGTVEHLKNPSLKKIRKYYSDYYIPNNMAVIVAGDFDPDKTIAAIDAAFGSLQEKPVPPFHFSPEQPRNHPDVVTVTGPESEYVLVGYRLPSSISPEAPLMTLTDYVLANSSAGLVDLNLVKKKKVLSAGAGIYQLKDYSILFMEGRPKTGQTLEQVKDLLLAQLDSLKEGKFDEKLLKAIILNKRVENTREMESNSGRAFKAVDVFVKSKDWKSQLELLDKMDRLGKEEVSLFAKRYLGNDYTIVYKRQGTDTSIEKIEKPEISPVDVNRNSLSRFAKDIMDNETAAVNPVFIDYQKDILHSELKPGLPLLQVKNKENDLFSLYYVFDFGRYSDQKLPEALELLKFLGTDKQSAEDISKEFYQIACNFSVSAGNEQIHVSLSGPDEKMERALAMFEYLLAHAVPDQEALDAQVADAIQERMDAKSSKYAIRTALGNYAKYGKVNPSNWILSNKQLKKLKADELVKIIHRLTSYPHTVLYYGPRSQASLKQLLNKYHITPDTWLSVPQAKEFKPLENTAPKILFADYDMVQAEIGWVRNAGAYSVAEQPEISMFNEYFGAGMSSVVFQTIRESKALAYSCYAYFSRPSKKGDPQFIGAYVGTQADKLDSAILAMNDLLQYMPESELPFSVAKSSLRTSIESDRIRNEQILFNYLSQKRLGIDYDTRKNTYEKLPSLDIKQVKDFHKRYFSSRPYTLYIVGSQKKISGNRLKQYGTVKQVKLKELFGY